MHRRADRSRMAKDKPYEPKHKGFDVEAQERAQATVDRARELQAGRGEYADDYLEQGPEEAARRRGESAEDVGASVERAKKPR